MRNYNDYEEINCAMDTLFKDIYPDGIPSNAYIDKTKTALGLTFSEFHAKRNSIIVVPTKQIIDDKINSYASLKPFAIHGDKKNIDDSLKAYLENDKIKHKKIVTTPDSFAKIIKVAKEAEMLGDVLNNYFCLLDEVHCYATEKFRGNILAPLNWFWKFKHKAVGSATPYHFSDPNFHKLDYIKLMFNETFGKIRLIIYDDVVEALAFLLSDLSAFEGNVHIFLNSVELINRIINKALLKGKDTVAIFCAEEERNANTLGDNGQYFRGTTVTGGYAKVNFYSTKYNEGWDLVDNDKCTFVLATDVGYRHSLASIQFKGFQAVGRLRSAEKIDGRPKHIRPNAIYHITNTIPLAKREPFKHFQTVEEEWYFEAIEHVTYYNTFTKKRKEIKLEDKGNVYRLIKPFAKIEDEVAVVVPTKVDQNVYEEYYGQFYYSGGLIKQAWEDMNYEVEVTELPSDLVPQGESRRAVNKRIVDTLEKIKSNPAEYDEAIVAGYIRRLNRTHKNLLLSYEALGAKLLEELDYDDDKMRKERVALSNRNRMHDVKNELLNELEFEVKKAKAEVKALLQAKYDKHKVYGNRGGIKRANVKDLKEMGIGFIEKGKTKYLGKNSPAIILIKPTLET